MPKNKILVVTCKKIICDTIKTEFEAYVTDFYHRNLVLTLGLDLIIFCFSEIEYGIKMDILKDIRNDIDLMEIPILILVNEGDKKNIANYLKAGASDCIIEPIEKDELIERCKKLITSNHKFEKIKRNLELLEHKASLGLLAAGLAHDLNNLFTELLLASSLLSEITIKNLVGVKKFEIIQFCQKIKTTIEIGKNETRGILNFIKNTKLEKSPNYLAPSIKSTLQLLEQKLNRKGIKLDINLSDDAEIFCNPSEIQRLILNLAVNAIQAMEKRNEERNLLVKSKKEGENLLIIISDTGSGLPEKIAEEIIFCDDEKQWKTSGLGLLIVKRIMREVGGKIEVQTSKGGTVFTLYFPIYKKED